MKKQRMRIISISLVFLLLQIVLAACGTPAQIVSHQAGGSASGNGGGINAAQISLAPDKRKKQSVVIKIGLNLPLSGADASLGISAEDGALLALNQAKIPGYTFQLVARDDANASGQPDAALAASNFNALSKDTQIAGIIGAFDAPTAEAELPLANKAQIALFSPSVTFTCLTQANPAIGCGTLLNTLRPTGNTTFFRLAPTDVQQGQALANFASQKRFAQKVSVIDDTSAYGVTLASSFISQFQANGGMIINHASVSAMPSYINLLTQIAVSRPDLIFYAGSSTEGATIRQQMLVIPSLTQTDFLGGNALHTTAFANAINPSAGKPVQSSSPALNVTTGSFVQQYQAKYGVLGTYSVTGYDSANIFIAAIKAILAKGVTPASGSNQTKASGKFRLALIQALAQTNLASISGAVQYTFTANGDPVNNVLEIDTLTPQGSVAQWVELTTENVM